MLTEQAGLCLCDTELSLLPFEYRVVGEIQPLVLMRLCIIYNHRYLGIYSLILKPLFFDICTGKAQHNVYMIYRRIEHS